MYRPPGVNNRFLAWRCLSWSSSLPSTMRSRVQAVFEHILARVSVLQIQHEHSTYKTWLFVRCRHEPAMDKEGRNRALSLLEQKTRSLRSWPVLANLHYLAKMCYALLRRCGLFKQIRAIWRMVVSGKRSTLRYNGCHVRRRLWEHVSTFVP